MINFFLGVCFGFLIAGLCNARNGDEAETAVYKPKDKVVPAPPTSGSDIQKGD